MTFLWHGRLCLIRKELYPIALEKHSSIFWSKPGSYIQNWLLTEQASGWQLCSVAQTTHLGSNFQSIKESIVKTL